MIFVVKAIIEDALDGHGRRTPAEDGWCCSKCLGKQRNTVIEIQKMGSINCKKSKSRKFVTAVTAVSRNQASNVSKVHWQVAFDSEGTRSLGAGRRSG